MQVLTLIKAVSIALAAGALSCLLGEWRFYRQAFQRSESFSAVAPDTGRLLRRTFGSAVLLALSVLMFLGRLPDAGQTSQAEVFNLFYYWSAVVCLAMVLVVTATYDALRGVRNLSTYVTAMEGAELADLAKKLKNTELEAELFGSEVSSET